MLAVTAVLNGGNLEIAYNAGDALAQISSDGTTYTVTGTGLAVARQFAVSSVTGRITVTDNAGATGQKFTVLAGTALANALQVDANVETTVLGGGISATRAGAVSIGSPVISLGANVSTAATGGAVAFSGAVTLTADTTVDAGAGAITFARTVDGTYRLVANSSAATTFGGAVGWTTALASLATNPGGTTVVGSPTAAEVIVKTNAAAGQVFNDAVRLAGNASFRAGIGSITFASTVDGTYRLTAYSQATTNFGGAVGWTTALASLMTNPGGTTVVGSPTAADAWVRTNTAAGQVFNDAVVLAGNTSFRAGVGPITFTGTVDGTYGLSAYSQAATTFGGAVGGKTGLASLMTNPNGTTLINGGAITTTTAAGQAFNDPVTLGASTAFKAGAAAVTFASTVDGAFLRVPGPPSAVAGLGTAGGASLTWTPPTPGYGVTLTTDTSGTTTFSAAVGGTTPLVAVVTSPLGSRVATGTITTAPITDYVVQRSDDNGTTWTTFVDGVSAAAAATVTGLTAGTSYVFRVAAVNRVGTGGFSAKSAAVVVPGTTTSAGPQILLTADQLTRLRQMAAANSPQWQAFRNRLDTNLDVVIAADIGSYEGEQLDWIADYALGYQVLEDSDPLTASKYADKAIGLVKSGLHDYQKGSWVAQQYLARGDGTTRTFTLPDATMHPGTLTVSLSPVTTYAVVHGPANGQDDVDYYQQFLKVSRTRDGAADYAPGADWRQNPDYANNRIDWSPMGAEPAVGSTYYVTTTSGIAAVPTTAFTLSGNRITLTQAPSANQAVYVQYIYGTHSADGSTLDYQQTSAGDGGFNSIFSNDTYTSRHLGTYLAIGLDWLDGYAGFRADLKQDVGTMLVRWADWLATPNVDAFGGYNGYYYTSPVSNYGAASYNALALTALALGTRNPAGPRLLDAALAYRQQYVLPALQNPTDSLKGGYWSEGWSYGHNAAQSLLMAARALESAGRVTATAEHQWADEVITNLDIGQSAPGLVYDGGDVYQYPFHLIDKSLFYRLSDMAGSPTAKAYANWYLQQYPDSAFRDPGDTNDYRDLLFHDPAAPAAYWSAQPLQNLAGGTGLLTARSDWGNTPTWVSLQMGNLLPADHQNYAPGQLQISRGSDKLLVNALQIEHVYGNDSAGLRSLSQFGNVVAVDNGGLQDQYGSPLQDTPYCMGVDYGTPGVVVTAFEGTAGHAYLNGDYHAAYSYASDPGAGGPTSALTRQLVYLRPDVIFVYDRVVTTQPGYDKQLRWNFDVTPVVSGNGFVVTAGDSKLFGKTFSADPLTTSAAQIQVTGSAPAVTYSRVTTRNTDTAANVAFLTVFETAARTKSAMDATGRVVTDDGRMEGGQIGNQLVLFGRNGDVNPATPLAYGVTGAAAVDHLLTNLRAGQAYRIVADNVTLTTATASSQGVLTFTTPAGTQRVQISAAA